MTAPPPPHRRIAADHHATIDAQHPMVDPRAVSSLVSLAGHLSISSFHSCQVKSKKTWESPLQSPLLHPQRGKLIRATYLPLCRRAQLLLRSPPPAPSPGLIISRDSTRNSDSGSGDYPEGKQSRSLLWIVQFLFSSRPLSRSYNRPRPTDPKPKWSGRPT